MSKIIAHITDTHLGDPTAIDRGANPKKNLKAILDHIALDKFDDIVVTGDLADKDDLPWFFEKLENYKPGFKITLGNHDIFSQVIPFYKNTKTEGEDELYYSHEDEFYKYIYMDSSSGEISEPQLAWLSQEINTLKHIVLFVHHPILGFPTGMDTTYPLKNRDTVNDILQESRHNITVFCGHYHMPDKRTDRKITQYITPSTAFQVKKNSPTIEINTNSFAYRIITLEENSIKTSLVTNFYDRFTQKSG
ncbi:metallophosphoesterase family protein [Flavobacterium alkalisoli]|uniref:metallophosphoesterase family protein n=1 Tax=Flavobacterium alkalisoli TaxID=2602769 RepID=UPI003A8D9C1E